MCCRVSLFAVWRVNPILLVLGDPSRAHVDLRLSCSVLAFVWCGLCSRLLFRLVDSLLRSLVPFLCQYLVAKARLSSHSISRPRRCSEVSHLRFLPPSTLVVIRMARFSLYISYYTRLGAQLYMAFLSLDTLAIVFQCPVTS